MNLLTKLITMTGLLPVGGKFESDDIIIPKPTVVSYYKQPLTNKQQKARNKNKRAAKVRHKL